MARSLQERLAALQKSVGRSEPAAVVDPPAQPPHPADRGMTDPMPLHEAPHPLTTLGFEPVGTEHVGGWVRVLRYDVLTRHGDTRFGDVVQANLGMLFRAARLQSVDLSNIRFYDTETTGLGTGAGTIPFLHSVGRMEGDEFAVYQYFLEDYGAESLLLEEVMSAHFTEGTVMVSFNGKSFDWPLLKSRLAMYRKTAPPLGQLDLLYPSRRLWKARLERVTLGAVEEAVLGLIRTDDLPGKEAPDRYFRYVDCTDATLVAPVFEHNATDVCSLVGLMTILAGILAGDIPVERASEHVAVGRYYDEWREYDLAEECFVAALACPDADWKGHWLYSLHLKRRQMWPDAAGVWEQMAQKFEWTVQPLVELAKYFEHRCRDYAVAVYWAELAMERAVQQVRLAQRGMIPMREPQSQGEAERRLAEDPVIQALRHRLARVKKKAEAAN